MDHAHPHHDAVDLLRRCGAEDVEHPGGTLFAHLLRVERTLGRWGADEALRLAGLCHAFYGTDGFPAPLLELARRPELADTIGADAEGLVYRYASCDRDVVYPQLGRDAEIAFRDRFTGGSTPVPAADLGWFMELTAANELDLAEHNPGFRKEHGPALLDFFTRTRELLSPAAWGACRDGLV